MKVFYLHLTYEGGPLLLPIYEDKLYLSIEQVSKILGLDTQYHLDYLNEIGYFKERIEKLPTDPSNPDSEKECLLATDIEIWLFRLWTPSNRGADIIQFISWLRVQVKDFSTTNIQK